MFYLFFKISSLTSNLLTMSSNGTDEKCSTSPLKYATCRVIIRVESNPEVIVLLPPFQISTDTLKFLLATTVEGGLCENASNFAGAKKELKHYNINFIMFLKNLCIFISINVKQEAHGPHHSPEKPVQIN